MNNKRESYTPEFKLKVVLESMQRDITQEEVCKKFGVSSSMIHRWRKEFQANAVGIFHDERETMEKQVEVVNLFYCYDRVNRKDKAFLADLEKHLIPLKGPLKITTWWEDMILGGADWKHEINKQLEESNIILLLVSPDFLASSHCRMIQQQAMELRKANKIFDVIPLLIRPVDLEHETIRELQSLPKNGLSISECKDKDKAWLEVRREIVEVVDKFRSQPQQLSDVREGFMFIGLYPINGYRWDTDLRPAPGLVKKENMPDAPWLVSEAVGRPEISQRYSIFREKKVLRDFAKLFPTLEAIKQFADSYGHLGNLVPLYYPDKVGQPDSILWSGEALQFWLNEIGEMNILVTLWEMIQNRQIEALREHIIWKLDPTSVLFVWRSSSGTIRRGTVIASEKISPALFYQLERGEVIKPALYFLCNEIHKRLEGHVNPTFFLAQQKTYMIPDSLLSALYILLLMEVQEHSVEPE